MALGSECPELLQLNVIETMPEVMTTCSVYDLDVDTADRMGLVKLSKEMITEDEDKMMIRNVPDQDGILAWHQLYLHYNRKTLARVLRIHHEAVHPKPLTSGIQSRTSWSGRTSGLCPANVQDMVYQTIDDVHEDYERFKQKILSWVNKMSIRSGPVLMDIGRADGGIPSSSVWACCNCGGWGPASRECPSDRGAKGSKTKGKVNGLDKGVGKGGKGGKTRATCGKVGQKVWECRARTVNAVGHAEAVDVMAVVGGETPTNKFQITPVVGHLSGCLMCR